MGDLLQVVEWTLERACPMRQGKNWANPATTREQLMDISRFGHAAKKDRVLDGICVDLEFEGTEHRLPTLFGFPVNDRLAKFGGVQAIKQNCGACEANIHVKDSQEIELAGCYDSFYLFASNEQVQKAVGEAGLESQLQNLFLPTDPIWFGLWVNSPLTIDQCQFLSLLLPRLASDESEVHELRRFLMALTIAVQRSLKLHVSLTPPGHADLGLKTIWWHCPRCKAGYQGDLELPDSTYAVCQVCNYRFDPKPTHTSLSFGMAEAFGKSLEEQLDEEHYEVFIQKYLRYRGYSKTEINQMFKAPPPTVVERVRILIDSHSNDEIATILNQEGRQTRRGRPYSNADIHNLCRRHNIQRNS